MPLSHYQYMPYVSGGEEVSKGDDTGCVEFILDPGTVSLERPLWLCTTDLWMKYDTLVVEPVDINGTDESAWVQLAAANPDGTLGAWGLPGDALAVSGTVGPSEHVYKKHFLRVTIPSGTIGTVKTDVRLSVSGNRTVVLG